MVPVAAGAWLDVLRRRGGQPFLGAVALGEIVGRMGPAHPGGNPSRVDGVCLHTGPPAGEPEEECDHPELRVAVAGMGASCDRPAGPAGRPGAVQRTGEHDRACRALHQGRERVRREQVHRDQGGAVVDAGVVDHRVEGAEPIRLLSNPAHVVGIGEVTGDEPVHPIEHRRVLDAVRGAGVEDDIMAGIGQGGGGEQPEAGRRPRDENLCHRLNDSSRVRPCRGQPDDIGRDSFASGGEELLHLGSVVHTSTVVRRRSPRGALPVPPSTGTPAFAHIAAPDAELYYVSIDPRGELAWEFNSFGYGGVPAHVIEVLTDAATNAYKDFLRRQGISYIIAGDEQVDHEVMLAKLGGFGIERLMVGGGGTINWSFVQQGLVDEVSMVLGPAANGDPDAPRFFTAKEPYSPIRDTQFELTHLENLGDGVVWLRYTPTTDNCQGTSRRPREDTGTCTASSIARCSRRDTP